MGTLDGKVAVVTGGGRGIGRAHALTLASEGAAVLVNNMGAELSGDGQAHAGPAEEVAAAIATAGGTAAVDTTDISDWDGARAVVETALKECCAPGLVQALVSVTGPGGLGGSIVA
ncbi:short chain dehydrogenase [Prauserella aidingensis]|uniref:SDR family NAD(P)-dependent oxidoreductase n=1 Tax=Prauserella aidingensis TaxID=387890 RepID=UPI0020A610E0|nr:SDR family NAD(P)-dependent oxidoreductase [Prauserella aidingensis]MCP2256303.1 short chain dehydrogenase [Prauserella aidingensis]